METNRIPDLAENTFNGMALWFAGMWEHELLFHPDDSPNQIIDIRTGESMFSAEECEKLESILSHMFGKFGNEVHEAAYPIFMRSFHGRIDV